MDHLTTVLRATHCRSTHHYFALDGLRYVESVRGQQLRSMLLRHYDKYLAGAKAPDTTFRDFQNHVIHVSDRYWGGAVLAAQTWLSQMLEQLRRKQWSAAAYACGVLSHYVTDPFMPLHTGQTSVEAVVHRPMEWSIFKSYDSILALWEVRQSAAPYTLVGSHATWLNELIIAGAENAHAHYHRLIELYDLESGVKNPTTGLNQESRQILAGIVGWTVTSWGQSLDRIAEIADQDIPEMSLTLPTLLATVDIPLSILIRKVSAMREQSALTALLKEYQATGTVVKNLPIEIVSVRESRQKDTTLPPPKTLVDPSTKGSERPITIPFPGRAESSPGRQIMVSDTMPATIPMKPVASERFRLAVTDDVIDAPSIGPKTAARLAEIGIKTVAHLLQGAPETVAQNLATNWITPELIRQWQCQAKLVCSIPELRGLDAQLLVAVGVYSREELSQADPQKLLVDIIRMAETSAGQRIVRSSTLPDLVRVQRWIQAAKVNNSKRSA